MAEETELKLPLKVTPRVVVYFEVVDARGDLIMFSSNEREAYEFKETLEREIQSCVRH